MTSRFLGAICLLCLLVPCAADDGDNPSPVDLLMEQVSRDLKKLSRQLDNEASKPSSLQLVDAMIKANEEAKALNPSSVGDRTGDEREKYLARYREGMDELGQCLASLKAALLADDTGKAEELVEQAYGLRKKYHEELL